MNERDVVRLQMYAGKINIWFPIANRKEPHPFYTDDNNDGIAVFSRAILSISIILFVIVSFIHREPVKQVKNFFSSALLWGMSLLFFLPLLQEYGAMIKQNGN